MRKPFNRAIRAAAAIPTALGITLLGAGVVGVGVAVVGPAAATQISYLAQSSGLSSSLFGSSNLSDYLKDENVPDRTPVRTEHPVIDGLPAGVSVDRVEWLDSHRIAVFIKSAVMPEQPIQVQILLARDWYAKPDATFPEVWALDGLRADDKENGWTLHTNIAAQFGNANVNVILPVGGESSFYTDWERPDNGKNYKWESFLLNELPAVLKNGYRSNGTRAIFGLSMGGTAAMNLAEHRPDMFNFVGSFSGYLDTTSPGMPAGISGALQDGGGYDATAMWGPEGSQRWIDNDPKLGVEALKGKTVYVSSGNGVDDFGKPGSVASGPSNLAGMGLEVMSRMTSQTFVDRAEKAGVQVKANFRPSGIHDWPYWQYELTQAKPIILEALGVKQEDATGICAPIGAIADAVAGGGFGDCLNNEYDVPGGKAQDFQSGRAFWSPATGAHVLIGRIGARYSELGGPASWLGFPISGEQGTPDGVGRYVKFEHGVIYWTPTLGAHAIPQDLFDAWGEEGWETGLLGYPTEDPVTGNDGVVSQRFEGGYVVRNHDQAYVVKGEIAKKYTAINTIDSRLGAPTSPEIPIQGGVLQNFENGTMYWSVDTGAHFILNGPIRDAWGAKGWEGGEYGWPTSDQESIPAGGETISFQHGTISQIFGKIVEEKK